MAAATHPQQSLPRAPSDSKPTPRWRLWLLLGLAIITALGTLKFGVMGLVRDSTRIKDGQSLWEEITLEADEYFTIGDNRHISDLGATSERCILGKVLF